jgi:PS-10 peptidase S37
MQILKSRAVIAGVVVTSISTISAVACSVEDATPRPPTQGQDTDAAPAPTPLPVPDSGGAALDGGSAKDSAAEDAAKPCLATDLPGRLACIPDVTVVSETKSDADAGVVIPAGYRRFELTIKQRVDQNNPASATFEQRLSLLHVSETAPMVLASSGYGLSRGRSELTRAFTSNQIQVEHRFFKPSVPAPPAWQYLNIRQSAADYHHIVTALKTIYKARWVNTGASKGGMTSVYHRRFYPADLDGTVAYVAPNVYGVDDQRFVTFLRQAGGDPYVDCRAKLITFQKAVLTNRVAIVAKMTGTYAELGSKDIALEHAVLELPFTFWQYGSPTRDCPTLPGPDASPDVLLENLDLSNYEDTGFDYFAPYYYQAATQLGAPGVEDAPLAGLLAHRSTYNVASYAPKGVPIVFDAPAMVDVADWVKASAKSIMFIYGEFDPWTAGAFELGAAQDSFRFIAPGRNHGANLGGLTTADQAVALEAVERWMGAKVTPPPMLGAGATAFFGGDEEPIKSRPRL